jgi:hypothetical protein
MKRLPRRTHYIPLTNKLQVFHLSTILCAGRLCLCEKLHRRLLLFGRLFDLGVIPVLEANLVAPHLPAQLAQIMGNLAPLNGPAAKDANRPFL